MIRKIFNALMEQAWTLLGMFVAWVVLEGSARTIVTYAIGLTTLSYVVWQVLKKDE